MNDLIITIGIVGSVSFFISLLIASSVKESKLLHLAYAIFITALATVAFEYKAER